MESELDLWRKGTYHFSMADVYENIHVLGMEYVARMKRSLPDYIFRTSVLNKRLDRVEGGFYPDLSDEHCYVAPEGSRLSAADSVMLMDGDWDSCEKDGDLIPGVMLEMAPDFGSSFNCVQVSQLIDWELNFLNQFYVKHPQKIKHVAIAFDKYYKTHKPKTVRLHFDHTMVGEDASREMAYWKELRYHLEKLGWTVIPNYIGQAWGHELRYILWGKLFERDPEFPKVQFNHVNMEPTLLAMRLAGARTTKKGFEKDKRPEQKDNVDQAEATHLTDAADLMVVGVILAIGSRVSGGVDILYG
jgi:hypothetical protein